MREQIFQPHTLSDTTAHENEAVLDLSILKAAWTKAAKSSCQLELFRNLAKAKTGVAEVENFLENLEGAKKYKKRTFKKDTKLLKNIMDRKLRDAESVAGDEETRKNRLRRKIHEIHGKNSRQSRKILKNLRNEATKVTREAKEKHNDKAEHLADKYREDVNKGKLEIPKNLERYANLSIFKEKVNQRE